MTSAHADEQRGMHIVRESSSVRRALIIGNQGYAKDPLLNSRKDAQDVAARLTSLGFVVALSTDVGMKDLAKAVDTYADTLHPTDVSFFYYSGHGIQVANENYLVPVDFAADKEEDAPYAAYALGRLLERLKTRNPALSVVVLDACRDNPYLKKRGGGGGLAGVDAAKGTLIAYATSPGSTASDGAVGGNGVYTKALLQRLAEPDDIENVFKHVRQDVYEASNGHQVPWSSSSVIGNYCLAGATCTFNANVGATPASPPAPAAVPAPAPAPPPDEKAPPSPEHPFAVAPEEKVAPVKEAKVVLVQKRKVANRKDTRTGETYVSLPGGGLHIGCEPADRDCYSDEKPGDDVRVKPFWLGRTEVTAGAYQACVDAGSCTAAGTTKRCNGVPGNESHPINCVTWNQADTFCRWIGRRLPTSAEWEYAAKSGGGNVFPWGAGLPTKTLAQFKPADRTVPVGSFADGADAFDVLDLAGNVREWTSSTGETPGSRQVRGGGFDSFPRLLRASSRQKAAVTESDPDLGFRCAADR